TNPLDSVKFKPELLPVTFSGIEPVIFKAVLRTVSEKKFERIPQIRVRHKTAGMDKYEFETVSVAKKGEDSYEAVIRSTNWPFEDRIACIDKFELLFEYSEDGQQWLKAGTTRNRLYITWREPLYTKFYKDDDESNDLIDMQMPSIVKGKWLINESLLWLGCTNAPTDKLLPEDEDAIVRSIFVPFESKKVIRAREGTEYLNIDWSKEGLGYWRGISTAENPIKGGNDPRSRMFYDKIKNEHIPRGVRTLLSYGEARCGEWTDFFLHLLLTQGIDVDEDRDSCAIVTDYRDASKLNDLGINRLRNRSVVFTVKDAIFTKNSKNIKEYIIKGKSEAKGNDDAQPYFADHVFVYFRQKFFLDPSYGVKFEEKDSTVKEYCKKCITSIFLEDRKRDEYVFIYSYKMNGFIIFDDLYNYIVPSHSKLF
ncbi:hypothetical protein, partial [Treponema pedis]|uniref:hypothetical protein n=1 Tax=Treponema pedis TaxID=409322 RepID=UPI00057027A3